MDDTLSSDKEACAFYERLRRTGQTIAITVMDSHLNKRQKHDVFLMLLAQMSGYAAASLRLAEDDEGKPARSRHELTDDVFRYLSRAIAGGVQ